MSRDREPIRWNFDALDTLKEIGAGILILIIMPLCIIPIAAAFGIMR
ncbi:hypothetical protein [Paenarthrobacter sp. NPDC018779]